MTPAQIRALYAEAALTCVPSAWGEPFGYAVAEAMALGVPVVGTPLGAGEDRGAEQVAIVGTGHVGLVTAVTGEPRPRGRGPGLGSGDDRFAPPR